MTAQHTSALGALPRYAPVSQACSILGFQRTKLYELAGNGLIRIVKVGGRSLVDMEAALAWMSTLPTADIAPSHKAGATA